MRKTRQRRSSEQTHPSSSPCVNPPNSVTSADGVGLEGRFARIIKPMTGAHYQRFKTPEIAPHDRFELAKLVFPWRSTP